MFFLLIILPSFAFSQEALSSGYIRMRVVDVLQKEFTQEQQGVVFLKGSTIEYQYEKDKRVLHAKLMGGGIKVDSYVDYNSGESDVFLSAIESNIWIDTSVDECREAVSNREVRLSYDKNNTKNIYGYNCYKFTLCAKRPHDSKIDSVSGYISEDIKAPGNPIYGFQNLDLAGFPLEMTWDFKFARIKFQTVFIGELEENYFYHDARGFTRFTFDEYRNLMDGKAEILR